MQDVSVTADDPGVPGVDETVALAVALRLMFTLGAMYGTNMVVMVVCAL